MRRPKRRLSKPRKPKLTIAGILSWADAFHASHGDWPTYLSGLIDDGDGRTWRSVDWALKVGVLGPDRKTTLARLMCQHSGRPYDIRCVRGRRLTLQQIRRWAAAHYQRTGRWPSNISGPVVGTTGETWMGINQALAAGYRGLPGGTSLAKVLGKKFGSIRRLQRPRLTVKQVLAWADAHHRATGKWPMGTSGPIIGAPHETWKRVHSALRVGLRGLPGKTTLARLLVRYRGVHFVLPKRTKLTYEQILAWADDHHRRKGKWPTRYSGRVLDAPAESWFGLNAMLTSGGRGLPRGTTLPQLLARHRGVRNIHGLPDLTEDQIVAWAKAHHRRTGRWPTKHSGPITDAPGETWLSIEATMFRGRRGLCRGVSLGRLLADRCGMRCSAYQPRLTLKRIRTWAQTHFDRTGQWPRARSGSIPEAPGESWRGVEHALARARRGLPAGHTIFRLTQGLRARAERERTIRPLSTGDILLWARAYCRRTGKWPDQYCGRIPDAPGETWLEVERALKDGSRGLPGGSSLRNLLVGRRKPKPIVHHRTRRRVQTQ